MNKDQVKGEMKKGKGKVKEVTGRTLGNDELERKGKSERAKGTVQNTYGDAKSNLKQATK